MYSQMIKLLFNLILIYLNRISSYSSELLSLILVYLIDLLNLTYLKEIGLKINELPNLILIYLNKIGYIVYEFLNLILIYSKDIGYKINEFFLLIYTIPLYPLYIIILLSIIILVKILNPELWNTRWNVFFRVAKRLLMIYGFILIGASILYVIYINTTIFESIPSDPNLRYYLFLFRVVSISVVIYIVIYKKFIKSITKDDWSRYVFSFCTSALLAILINIIFSAFIFPEIIFIFIGEGLSGSSGSNPLGNNPGEGAPRPPKPPTDYSSIIWKSDNNSEGSNSKSNTPVNNSEGSIKKSSVLVNESNTTTSSSKRAIEETGILDNHYTKRVRQLSDNYNRYMTVLQQVEDYSVARLREIKTELTLVKTQLQEMEDIIKKVPGGLNSVPANMEWYNIQNPRPNRTINSTFQPPEGVSSFYEYNLTGTYNVREDRSISTEYEIKIRERVQLEREFAHLKSVSLKIREAAPTGVVRAKYFPKNI